MGDVNLRAALLAAAEEAGKLQEESKINKCRISNLEDITQQHQQELCRLDSHARYLEDENRKLRECLTKAGEILQGLGQLLTTSS
jgi:hypothetical protein